MLSKMIVMKGPEGGRNPSIDSCPQDGNHIARKLTLTDGLRCAAGVKGQEWFVRQI
jgi:hypothetical protein